MASVIGCMTEPDERSSSRVVKRVVNVSLPELVSLRSREDFSRVLKEGKRHRSGGIVLVRLERPAEPARVGLVVPRSSGNAVTRNRIKRRLRHTVRSMRLKPGNDYVIIATNQVAAVPQPGLEGWLERALEKTAIEETQ